MNIDSVQIRSSSGTLSLAFVQDIATVIDAAKVSVRSFLDKIAT